MAARITVDPGKLSQFGQAAGSTFCLVTNPELTDALEVAETAAYDRFLTLTISAGERFEDLLEKSIPELSPYSRDIPVPVLRVPPTRPWSGAGRSWVWRAIPRPPRSPRSGISSG
ncbi:hypothetical protein GCM10020000_24460 [Streptomyces olivoverticillatus]